jgi:hypothetical protein
LLSILQKLLASIVETMLGGQEASDPLLLKGLEFASRILDGDEDITSEAEDNTLSVAGDNTLSGAGDNTLSGALDNTLRGDMHPLSGACVTASWMMLCK